MDYCGESGTIRRETVIKVLEKHQVAVLSPGTDDMVIMAGAGTVQAQRLPELVPRRMIHYLSRTFRIRIELFYH